MQRIPIPSIRELKILPFLTLKVDNKFHQIMDFMQNNFLTFFFLSKAFILLVYVS